MTEKARRRRTFTPEYKQAIVEEYNRYTERGAKAALLRREDLNTELITLWRKGGRDPLHGAREAYWRAARGSRTGLTPLARFLVRKVDQLGVSQAELARRVGVTPTTVTDWIQGAVPTSEPYERLRAMFDDVPELVTATDRARAAGRELAARYGSLATSPEAIRKRAQSQRGQRRGPSARSAAAARKRMAEGRQVDLKALKARQTPAGYANWYLALRMAKLGGTPGRAQLREWAQVVASRGDLNADAIVAIWRPELRRRGLRVDGRPLDESRCQMIEDLRREYGDRRGFWTWAAPRVWAAEAASASVGDRQRIEARTVDYLRLWHRQHLPRCSRRG